MFGNATNQEINMRKTGQISFTINKTSIFTTIKNNQMITSKESEEEDADSISNPENVYF